MEEYTVETYTIEDLIQDLMEDEEWEVPMQLRKAFLPGLAFALFTA